MRRILFFIPLLLLTGCSVYHPLRGGVGYSDIPVGLDGYEVTFVGTSDTTVGQARWYCQLRAAELSVLRNDPYFQVLNESVYLKHGTYYFPNAVGPNNFGPGTQAYPGFEPGSVQPYVAPEVTMKVELSPVPGEKTIPAAYLIREAEHRKIELSPGVAERAAGMPVESVRTLPPPPSMKPAPIEQSHPQD